MGEDIATLPNLLASTNVKKKFEDMLGKKAAGFVSSILSAVNSNPKLKKAEPWSVISAASIAASLDLPINPSLGFAHIVPYGGVAQFQIGWKGYVQLAQRTGQYLTINASPVCEGELISNNPFTGEMNLSRESRKSDKVIGYVLFFKLLNGFEKYYYMTKEQCEKHGKRYSDSYSEKWSWWQKDFDLMGLKTVVKGGLSKWGILSTEMQIAIQTDQATVKQDGSYEYPDNEPNVSEEKEIHKGVKGLKAALGKKIDETANKESLPTRQIMPGESTESREVQQHKREIGLFEKKYFDLLAAINDAENISQLLNLESEFQSKLPFALETPPEDIAKITALIEKKKREFKK